jgi:signal transduction histidine kinase/ActR/RegA family two-component response regulator
MSSTGLRRARLALGVHRRLETHVILAVTLIVAFALTTALLIATRVVTDGAFARASTELAAARSALLRLQDDRAAFAASQASLVTALPVFRAHMTDSRLLHDAETMQVMVDEYRKQLNAAFCLVTGRSGAPIAQSGLGHDLSPEERMQRIVSASSAGESIRDITDVRERLFLVVSEPARFAEDTLGSLTVGYALDDAAARQLAGVTHCDVNIIVGRRLAATSLPEDQRLELAARLANGGMMPADGDARTEQFGATEYVAAAFPFRLNGGSTDAARLLLLQDWAPTRVYLARLRSQLALAGAIIFIVALAGGLGFARRVSRPLEDIAAAARDIASGNWTRRVAVRGSAEAHVLARAFNDMAESLRHWSEEAKRRHDELRQTQKMEAVGRLAGGIAHDFNNILTTIRGYGELALLQITARDPAHEELTEIVAAVDRAGDLTKQLLTFSRRQAAHARPIAIDQVVAGTEQMLRRLIREDIQLTTEFEPDVGYVRADRGQIEQVLLNLVINARDAMPNGGMLRISVSAVDVAAAANDVEHEPLPQKHVCLTVADSGHGMDPQIASRIFEPFFTTKGVGEGTGLGLAIVYGIVQQAGGMIDVDTDVGRGTTFRLYFPRIADVDPSEVPVHAGDSASLMFGSETILVAEDDEHLRALIVHALRKAGYGVLEGADGEQVLSIARNYAAAIHLLLADVVMPRLSGPVVAERVLAIHAETRVLFMSGHSEDAVAGFAIDGTAPFIYKPFTMDGLLAKVRETLETPQDDWPLAV